jgi:hypothetical protein
MMLRTLFTFATLMLVSGCSKSDRAAEVTAQQLPQASPAAAHEPPGPQIDPCALLTPEEIQEVFGEPLKEVRRKDAVEELVRVSQCMFEMPTPENTIILTVSQKADVPDARNPRDVWAESFSGEDREGIPAGRKRLPSPTPIVGLGDAAYWTGRPKRGALYVLKGNSYFRINMGGREELEAKIEKCKALAAKILAREF